MWKNVVSEDLFFLNSFLISEMNSSKNVNLKILIDFDFSGLVTGPSKRVTCAPALAKSRAIICPSVPLDKLLIMRMVSIGTPVGPQVISTFLFFRVLKVILDKKSVLPAKAGIQ